MAPENENGDSQNHEPQAQFLGIFVSLPQHLRFLVTLGKTKRGFECSNNMGLPPNHLILDRPSGHFRNFPLIMPHIEKTQTPFTRGQFKKLIHILDESRGTPITTNAHFSTTTYSVRPSPWPQFLPIRANFPRGHVAYKWQ